MDPQGRSATSGLVATEVNQVKFSITVSPEQEPIAKSFLNKYDHRSANFVLDNKCNLKVEVEIDISNLTLSE